MEAFHGEKQNEHGVWKKIWKVFIMFFTIHAVDTGRKLNVQDVFWTSYVRSIYVLCLRGLLETYKKYIPSNLAIIKTWRIQKENPKKPGDLAKNLEISAKR